MRTVSLNLSRKWRSQNFDQIVGQSLAIRILKNSLYLDHFFPVYLFAGQRGCGKTSTARVFSAAINCIELPRFQKDPKNATVPCLLCESCIAMKEGNHPDFIEIDAASHTGVDNIRNIIESSSLLPIMGSKRVYLIDEAHMLSKAAFNAALKILEEPPPTALFILATTNQQKIIDTVRSRCFQLFFSPISHDPLKAHLQQICKEEKIIHDGDALDLIIRHTEGSARDALNLLEQVRFSHSMVNKEAVLALLGHIGDYEVLQIIDVTLHGNSVQLLQLLQTLKIDKYAAEFIWERLMALLRVVIWLKYGVQPQSIILSVDMIEIIAKKCSLTDVHRMVDLLYTHEELFFKTTQQHIFLEMILLRLCRKDTKKPDDGEGSALVVESSQEGPEKLQEIVCVVAQPEQENEPWSLFVGKIGALDDPIITTLFKQARLIAYDMSKCSLVIELSKDFVLFSEQLQAKKELWQPLLRATFSSNIVLEVQFTGTNKLNKNDKQVSDDSSRPRIEKKSLPVAMSPAVQYKEKAAQPSSYQSDQLRDGQFYKPKTLSIQKRNELSVDVSDEKTWKIAPMLLRYFPGVITEIGENR